MHGDVPGGHEGPDGVYQRGNGNGDWFYRSAGTPGTPERVEVITEAKPAVPGKDAVPAVLGTDAIPAVTKMVPNDDAITCDEVPTDEATDEPTDETPEESTDEPIDGPTTPATPDPVVPDSSSSTGRHELIALSAGSRPSSLNATNAASGASRSSQPNKSGAHSRAVPVSIDAGL